MARARALTYAVERGGLTRLRVEGHEFDGEAIQALRTAWADSPIDEFVAEAVSDAARLALAHAGYVRPQVNVKVATAGEDAEAIVTITPGPRSDEPDVLVHRQLDVRVGSPAGAARRRPGSGRSHG